MVTSVNIMSDKRHTVVHWAENRVNTKTKCQNVFYLFAYGTSIHLTALIKQNAGGQRKPVKMCLIILLVWVSWMDDRVSWCLLRSKRGSILCSFSPITT